MIYILDFDRTLFDVEKLYLELDKIGKSHLAGTSESFDLLPFRTLLFSDTVDFIKNKENVFILSSSSGITGDWETEYQKRKIKQTCIDELVDEVIVMAGEKGVPAGQIAEQFGPQEQVVFVDDRIEQCLSVKSRLPDSLCFLMVRNPEVVGGVNEIQGIKVVHTLKEVDDIIKEI